VFSKLRFLFNASHHCRPIRARIAAWVRRDTHPAISLDQIADDVVGELIATHKSDRA
jgi:hypothetical protein